MTRTLGITVRALAALALCGGGLTALAQTTSGSWSHYPPQQPTYTSIIRPPIKANGSSVFDVGSTIPVKFKLATGTGVFLFDSVWSNNFVVGGDGEHNDDFAFLTFTPSTTMTFPDVTNLSADYTFAMGNCQGGSLRWTVTFDIGNDDNTVPGEEDPDPRANDRSIFIYYGGYPNFTDCTTGPNNQSGVNMIGLTDLRYDTSQIGGTFYDSYANALTLAGTLPIAGITLALDSGWMQEVRNDELVYKDQSVNLTRAAVNDNAFVPVVNEPSATCNLPPATITVIEDTAGYVDNPLNAQRKFTDVAYRSTNECTYSYNLLTDSLFGPGSYRVYLVINNQAILNPGRFTLQ